jgi:mannose-6-phosphate isomerase-like protein (cupin superfamily)
MEMTQSSTYNKVLSACERFGKDRRIEPVRKIVSQARLFDYGFRSLVGPLEVTREKILEAYKRSHASGWYFKQILGQLDIVDALRQVEVPGDFRAATVHFATYHKALYSIKENLEKACEISKHEVEPILNIFVQALNAVTESNGLYLVNWREPKEWTVLYVPDVGLKVVKLIYANRHSMNLAIIPKKVGVHKHKNTSEIHFSLEATDGDQILGCYRLHVIRPHAIPIKPGEWHAYVENRTSRPHQLLFLTGSSEILGWGIVNDRTLIEPSRLALRSLGQEWIEKIGGVLLEKEIQNANYLGSKDNFFKELISGASSEGVNLNIVAVPETWTNRSQDVIQLVVRGKGELTALSNRVEVREGDAFAIPFGITYRLNNRGKKPLILLSSILDNTPHNILSV